MEIKVKSIKLFCSIVETGSLIAAANKNLLSAPAASRVLSQLEDRLGFKLFHRTNRNLSLTEEGADFYRIAMESVRAWKHLEDYPIRRSHHKRILRVALLARHTSDVTLPAVVKILKKHEEHLRVTIDVHASRDIYYSKYSHPFDVGFGILLSDHDDLVKVNLANLPFCLVMSKENPLSNRKILKPADFARERFIVLSRDIKERNACGPLLGNIDENQIVGEVSSTQVAIRMTRKNVGVHLTDVLAAVKVSDDCAAIPVADPLTIPFSVFWPKSSTALSPEAIECIAEIVNNIQQLGIEVTEDGQSFLQGKVPEKYLDATP